MGPQNNTTKKSKEIHWKPPHKPTSAAEIIEIEPPKAKTETMSSGRPDPKAPCQGAIHSTKPETSSIPDVGCNPTPVVDNLRSNVAAPPGLPEGPEMHHEGKGESSNAAAPPEPTSDPTQTLSDKLQNLEQAFSIFQGEVEGWKRKVGKLEQKLENAERLESELRQELEGVKQEWKKDKQELERVKQELEEVKLKLEEVVENQKQMHRALCRRQIVIAIYKVLGASNWSKFWESAKANNDFLKKKLLETFQEEKLKEAMSQEYVNEFTKALDLEGDDSMIKQGNIMAHEYTFGQGEEYASDIPAFKFFLNYMQQEGYQVADEIGGAATKEMDKRKSREGKIGGPKQ